MATTVTFLSGPSAATAPVELVERKGLGHPDTICDALAEELSLTLGRHYRERFGLLLHHNVDKVLLSGGASAPRLGGGRIVKPIRLIFAGRATAAFDGKTVPIAALVRETARGWLARNLPHLDPARGVRISSLIKPGSADLVDLFQRQAATGTWLANDTSIGVGYAPLSPLEALVDRIERALNAPSFKVAHPACGEDIKVMGVRQNRAVGITLACAMVDRHVPTVAAYRAETAAIAAVARAEAAATPFESVAIAVNAADDIPRESLYLTVTGTSAEAGDDGEAGRGNRANGLITPYRPMTMESVFGKNPTNHVGKLYNIVAGLIADRLVTAHPAVRDAEVTIVSRIGQSIAEPQAVDIRLRAGDDDRAGLAAAAERIAADELGRIDRLAEALVAREIVLGAWPLRAGPAQRV